MAAQVSTPSGECVCDYSEKIPARTPVGESRVYPCSYSSTKNFHSGCAPCVFSFDGPCVQPAYNNYSPCMCTNSAKEAFGLYGYAPQGREKEITSFNNNNNNNSTSDINACIRICRRSGCRCSTSTIAHAYLGGFRAFKGDSGTVACPLATCVVPDNGGRKEELVAPSHQVQRISPIGEPRPVCGGFCGPTAERSALNPARLHANPVCFADPYAVASPNMPINDQGFGECRRINPYASGGPCYETGCRRPRQASAPEVRSGGVDLLENSVQVERRVWFDQGVVHLDQYGGDHYSLGSNQVQQNAAFQADEFRRNSRQASDVPPSRPHQVVEEGGKGDRLHYTYVRPDHAAMEADAHRTFLQEGSDRNVVPSGRAWGARTAADCVVGKASGSTVRLSGVNSPIRPGPSNDGESVGDRFGYLPSLKQSSITMCRKSSKVATAADVREKEVHLPEVDKMNVEFIKGMMNQKTAKRFDDLWRLSFGFDPNSVALTQPMKCPNADAQLAVRHGLAVPLPKDTPITCHAFSVLEDKLKLIDGGWNLSIRRRRIDWARRFNEEHAKDYKCEIDLRHNASYFPRCRSEAGATFDLKASFYQVQAPDVRLFTFVDDKGDVYGITRMPMGICTAPEIMQILTCTLAGDPLYSKPEFSAKVGVDVWIDNILFSGPLLKVQHQEEVFKQRAKAANATLNSGDSSAASAHQTFIGIDFDFQHNTVDWSRKTEFKIKALTFMRQMVLGDLESAISRLMYASSIKGVRIASFYWAIKFIRRLLSDVNSRKKKREDVVEVPESAFKHLLSWKATLLNAPARSMLDDGTSSDFTLMTDASDVGWGAVLIDEATQQVWVTGERWSQHYMSAHINVKEAAAVRFGIFAFPHLQGKRVLPFIDNTSALGAIENGYSPSEALNLEILRLDEAVRARHITFRRPTYVKSKNNLADYWSRHFVDSTGEWAPSC